MARDMAEKRRQAAIIVRSQLNAGASIARTAKEVEVQLRVTSSTARGWVEDELCRMADSRRSSDDDNLKLLVLESHLISVLHLAKEAKDPKTALAVLKELRIVYGFREDMLPLQTSLPKAEQTQGSDPDPPARKGDLENLSTEELKQIADQNTNLELTSAQADRLVEEAEAKL